MKTDSHQDHPVNSSSALTNSQDGDSFELYDLRVEVICPPGARILCGAKEGDHFTLEGEMLYLPPGQGFSIYSLDWDANFLVRIYTPAVGRKAAGYISK
ncbi:hypothetical protein PHLCEN_2v12153 [Hermanssonia centrifuga]|uniref:Uncharacterized protein n=1 Tax=Hermanssonia centrifuga TaxID=98765 RepID=A0A2R6NHZ0_9APHY|nr:hypothetical protein PHLCEN_2v12153 [Hermanssonia centrifuga]